MKPELELTGLVINPFSDNLVLKTELVRKLHEADQKAAQMRQVKMTPQQFNVFVKKQVEFGVLPKRLYAEGETTLLKVTLVTGKSHQIRAHLSSIGHPIIGDPKYGERKVNAFFRETHGIKNQMLHAWKLTFPELAEPLDNLSEKSFEAEPAGLMKQYLMKVKGDLQ